MYALGINSPSSFSFDLSSSQPRLDQLPYPYPPALLSKPSNQSPTKLKDDMASTAAVPATCCGREGGCICAKEATCSCGKQSAMHCNCEKSATENKTSGARCSCSKYDHYRSCSVELHKGSFLLTSAQTNVLLASAHAAAPPPRTASHLAQPVHAASGPRVSVLSTMIRKCHRLTR